MNKIILFLSFVFLPYQAFAVEEPSPVQTTSARKKVTPFQVSVCSDQPSIQLFNKEYTVKGLRLNLFSGYNEEVNGLDLGLVGGSKKLRGIQANYLLNHADEFKGVRIGIWNSSQRMSGIEIGVMNGFPFVDLLDSELEGRENLKEGLQIGIFNWAAYFRGLQLGLFNRAQYLDGLQIGLMNWNHDFEVMPFVNFKKQF